MKPGETEQLFDLIRRGAPEQAAEIAKTYGHDLSTPKGRAEFVGEFVAKASSWAAEKPALWRRIADVLYRLAGRVGWLRQLAPERVLAAEMRGLASAAKRQLRDRATQATGHNLPKYNSSSPGHDSTGPKFSLAPDGAPIGTRQFSEQFQDAKDISDALKGTVSNNTYEVRPNETTAAAAAAVRLINSDHPHACGENFAGSHKLRRLSGPSPRMRFNPHPDLTIGVTWPPPPPPMPP